MNDVDYFDDGQLKLLTSLVEEVNSKQSGRLNEGYPTLCLPKTVSQKQIQRLLTHGASLAIRHKEDLGMNLDSTISQGLTFTISRHSRRRKDVRTLFSEVKVDSEHSTHATTESASAIDKQLLTAEFYSAEDVRNSDEEGRCDVNEEWWNTIRLSPTRVEDIMDTHYMAKEAILDLWYRLSKHALPLVLVVPNHTDLQLIREFNKGKKTRLKGKHKTGNQKLSTFPDKIFQGACLRDILYWDKQRHPHADLKIPIFFARILQELRARGVTEKGIFRKSSLATSIKNTVVMIDKDGGPGAYVYLKDMPPHDLVGLLKYFLNSLPEPLFTNRYSITMENIAELPDLKDQIRALQDVILLLPQENRNCLKALLLFFLEVSSHEEETLMSVSALSRLMWPTLCQIRSSNECVATQAQPTLQSSAESGTTPPGSSLPIPAFHGVLEKLNDSLLPTTTTIASAETFTKQWALMELLLTHLEQLWTIPASMLPSIFSPSMQSNNDSHSSKNESKGKSLCSTRHVGEGCGSHCTSSEKRSDTCSIEVRCSRLDQNVTISCCVQRDSTAESVVHSFVHSYENFHHDAERDRAKMKYLDVLRHCGRLYYFHFNSDKIMELCLNHSALIFELCQRNPATRTEWQVKPAPDYHFLYRDYPHSKDDTDFKPDFSKFRSPNK